MHLQRIFEIITHRKINTNGSSSEKRWNNWKHKEASRRRSVRDRISLTANLKWERKGRVSEDLCFCACRQRFGIWWQWRISCASICFADRGESWPIWVKINSSDFSSREVKREVELNRFVFVLRKRCRRVRSTIDLSRAERFWVFRQRFVRTWIIRNKERHLTEGKSSEKHWNGRVRCVKKENRSIRFEEKWNVEFASFSCHVFLGNLCGIKSDQLREYCSQFGSLVDLNIHRDREQNVGKREFLDSRWTWLFFRRFITVSRLRRSSRFVVSTISWFIVLIWSAKKRSSSNERCLEVEQRFRSVWSSPIVCCWRTENVSTKKSSFSSWESSVKSGGLIMKAVLSTSKYDEKRNDSMFSFRLFSFVFDENERTMTPSTKFFSRDQWKSTTEKWKWRKFLRTSPNWSKESPIVRQQIRFRRVSFVELRQFPSFSVNQLTILFQAMIQVDVDLRTKFDELERQFQEYKINKQNEIEQLRFQLNRAKQDLSDITQLKLDQILKVQLNFYREFSSMVARQREINFDSSRTDSSKKRRAEARWNNFSSIDRSSAESNRKKLFSPRFSFVFVTMKCSRWERTFVFHIFLYFWRDDDSSVEIFYSRLSERTSSLMTSFCFRFESKNFSFSFAETTQLFPPQKNNDGHVNAEHKSWTNSARFPSKASSRPSNFLIARRKTRTSQLGDHQFEHRRRHSLPRSIQLESEGFNRSNDQFNDFILRFSGDRQRLFPRRWCSSKIRSRPELSRSNRVRTKSDRDSTRFSLRRFGSILFVDEFRRRQRWSLLQSVLTLSSSRQSIAVELSTNDGRIESERSSISPERQTTSIKLFFGLSVDLSRTTALEPVWTSFAE